MEAWRIAAQLAVSIRKWVIDGTIRNFIGMHPRYGEKTRSDQDSFLRVMDFNMARVISSDSDKACT